MAIETVDLPVGADRFVARAAGPEDGELVLLLHGFPQSSWSWRHQLEALGAAGYRAVAPDQRGYSPGVRPEAVDAYGTLPLVNDVLAMADELGGHTFHLVGHDWGAAVAWQVAGRHPARLRTLTVLSVPHPRAMLRALSGEAGCDQPQRSSYFKLFRQEDAPDRFLADDAALLRGLFLGTGLAAHEAEPYVELMRQPGAMRCALNWYRAMGRDVAEGLSPVTPPTLFVWSTDDPALGREGAEWTADYVEGPYRFEVLEGIGHWIPEQAPDRLNALLLEHLS